MRLRGATVGAALLNAEPSDFVDEWYHIGMQYLSPFRPTYHRVRPVADPGEVDPSPVRYYVESCGQFLRGHKAMSPFQKCARISMQVYRLETALRELPRVTPRVVSVIRFPGFEESVQWWPRRQAQRRARAAGDEPDVASGDEDAPMALEDAAAAAEPPEEEEDEGEEPEPLVHILGPLEMLLDRYEEPAPEVGPADPAVEAEAPEFEPAPGAAVAAAGLAAVAAVPPPPEPVGDLPDRAVAVRPRARGRGAPDALIQIPEGKIAFYLSNGDFTAYCARHEEDKCTLSRARRAGAAGTAREMAGRPIWAPHGLAKGLRCL